MLLKIGSFLENEPIFEQLQCPGLFTKQIFRINARVLIWSQSQSRCPGSCTDNAFINDGRWFVNLLFLSLRLSFVFLHVMPQLPCDTPERERASCRFVVATLPLLLTSLFTSVAERK